MVTLTIDKKKVTIPKEWTILEAARSLGINITSGVLFPPKIGRSVASSIKDCTYAELSSLFGHDGFLVESKALNAILAPFFESSLG